MWFSASFIKLVDEDKNTILNFCNLLNLKCECKTKLNKCSKYCKLCFNILKHPNDSEIFINEREIIHVKTVIMYHKYICNK